MKPEPIFAAVESLRTEASTVVLMTPQGRRFAQSIARTLSAKEHLIIVCGHYEGVDHRVIEHLIDAEISIGDYVLTNGAIAAVVFVDAIVRLLFLGSRATNNRRSMTASPAACSKRRNTPGRPSSAAGKFQIFSFPDTTPKSPPGADAKPSVAPARTRPDLLP